MFAHVYFIYIAHVITAVALAKVLHTDTNYTVKGLKILIQSNNKREEKAFLCEFVHLSNNTGPACLSLHHRCVCVCVCITCTFFCIFLFLTSSRLLCCHTSLLLYEETRCALIQRISNSSTASQEFCAKATEKNCNSSRLWHWCCNQCVLSLIRSKAGTHTGRFRDLLSKWSCSYSIIHGGYVWVCFMGNWGWQFDSAVQTEKASKDSYDTAYLLMQSESLVSHVCAKEPARSFRLETNIIFHERKGERALKPAAPLQFYLAQKWVSVLFGVKFKSANKTKELFSLTQKLIDDLSEVQN